jgi:hypothetical protein
MQQVLQVARIINQSPVHQITTTSIVWTVLSQAQNLFKIYNVWAI